jgi:hypothetical protein
MKTCKLVAAIAALVLAAALAPEAASARGMSVNTGKPINQIRGLLGTNTNQQGALIIVPPPPPPVIPATARPKMRNSPRPM